VVCAGVARRSSGVRPPVVRLLTGGAAQRENAAADERPGGRGPLGTSATIRKPQSERVTRQQMRRRTVMAVVQRRVHPNCWSGAADSDRLEFYFLSSRVATSEAGQPKAYEYKRRDQMIDSVFIYILAPFECPLPFSFAWYDASNSAGRFAEL
jgi:hypothetical protein